MTVLSLLAELLCCIAYTKLSVDLFDKPDSSKFYVWPALPLFWYKFLKAFKIVLEKYSNDLAGNTHPDGPTIEEEEEEEEGHVEAMILRKEKVGLKDDITGKGKADGAEEAVSTLHTE